MKTLSSLLLVFSVVACGGKESTSSSTAVNSTIGSIDISDAKQIFVTGADEEGLYLTDPDVLKPETMYKETEDGIIQEVSMKDLDGNIVTTVHRPNGIIVPDPRVIMFMFPPNNAAYIVNKADNKAYALDDGNSLLKVRGNLKSDELPITFYCTTIEKYELYKATFEEGHMSLTLSSAVDHTVYDFRVDEDENIVYAVGDTFYLRSVLGKFKKLSEYKGILQAKDGVIFGLAVDNASGDRIARVDNAVTGTVIKDGLNAAIPYPNVDQPFYDPEIIVQHKKKIVMANGNAFSIIDTESGDIESMTVDFTASSIRQSGDVLFSLSTDKDLYTLDLTTKTASKVVVEDLLEIRKYESRGDGTLMVNGAFTDGSSFIGELSASGELNVLSKTGSGTVHIIMPL